MKEQMERDGSLAQFRMDVRQNKCINKILESADISETEADAAKEKPKKAKKTVKKSTKKQAEEKDQ